MHLLTVRHQDSAGPQPTLPIDDKGLSGASRFAHLIGCGSTSYHIARRRRLQERSELHRPEASPDSIPTVSRFPLERTAKPFPGPKMRLDRSAGSASPRLRRAIACFGTRRSHGYRRPLQRLLRWCPAGGGCQGFCLKARYINRCLPCWPDGPSLISSSWLSFFKPTLVHSFTVSKTHELHLVDEDEAHTSPRCHSNHCNFCGTGSATLGVDC